MVTRRDFNKALALTGLLAVSGCATAGASHTAQDDVVRLDLPDDVVRIGFGSCNHQEKAQDFWPTIKKANPDLFVCLGDLVYPGKSEQSFERIEDAFRYAFQRQEAHQSFNDFRQNIPFLGIWDDNDYGRSDAGGEFPEKALTRSLYLDFLGEPNGSLRRTRSDGIYVTYEFGPVDKPVQLILLDLRYNRSNWTRHNEATREALLKSGYGPYAQNSSSEVTMLGETQWAWLQRILRRPASARIIGTSIQFSSEGRGWEAWPNFPHEKARLKRLIAETRAKNVVFISGDVHYGEVSVDKADTPYPLWDLTSSGLTELWSYPGPNLSRYQNHAYPVRNFGMIHVALASQRPQLLLELRSITGEPLFQKALELP